MTGPDIPIKLNVYDLRVIIFALGERPFKMVFELIGKINDQVNRAGLDDPSDACTLRVNAGEMALMVSSLSVLPYAAVAGVMDKIKAQACSDLSIKDGIREGRNVPQVCS